MAGNQVTLTIAGDADSLQRATDQAESSVNSLEREMEQTGGAARAMGSQIGSAEDAFAGLGRESGKLGEGLDRAAGASSMLSGGLGDVGGALTEAFGEDSGVGQFGAQMEKAGTIVMGLTGVFDLATLANTALQGSMIRTAAASVWMRTTTIAGAVATGVATAAQWLWNAAMTANPIGLIILAVAALVAGIIWLATQTDFFQKLWTAVWGAVVAYFNWVVGNYKAAAGVVVGAISWIGDTIGKVPGWLRTAFGVVYNVITAPFRAAFNAVASMWNNTVGRLTFSIPSWVPGIGGRSFSAPRLPTLHSGGRVPGMPGQNVLAILQAGETIGSPSASGAGGGGHLTIGSDGSRLGDLLVEVLASAVRGKGGDPGVLGIRIAGAPGG